MLSNLQILHHLQLGEIVIEPFNRNQLGTNSYDVRLGRYYYRMREAFDTQFHPYVDFTDQDDSERFWEGPFDALHYTNLYEFQNRIVIPAGETVLAHTQEIVGAKGNITTSMRARSSIGRSCLSVCKCAGVGDVGFINRWTMEISNHSTRPILLPVGLRVAQIEFYCVGQLIDGSSYQGKYQTDREWEPADMLPRLYLDQDYKDYQI